MKTLKKKSRYKFCKIFFLLLSFLILILKKKKINNNTSLFFKQYNIIYNNVFHKNINLLSDVLEIQNKNYLYLKKHNYVNNLNSYTKITKLPIPKIFRVRPKNLNLFKLNLVIFTKTYSHFVILRAPFRDKISKNLLQHQRFYVYLNLIYNNSVATIFVNKFFLFWFIKNFQKLPPLNSNILFLQSQKISFFAKLNNFLLKM